MGREGWEWKGCGEWHQGGVRGRGVVSGIRKGGSGTRKGCGWWEWH